MPELDNPSEASPMHTTAPAATPTGPGGQLQPGPAAGTAGPPESLHPLSAAPPEKELGWMRNDGTARKLQKLEDRLQKFPHLKRCSVHDTMLSDKPGHVQEDGAGGHRCTPANPCVQTCVVHGQVRVF